MKLKYLFEFTKNRIVNEIPIVGKENENHWALHGDTYMKGAWIMHTLKVLLMMKFGSLY